MRAATLCRTISIVLFVLALWGMAGCGLVHDAALGVGTIQLPPGKLYSSEFYATATPGEVRKTIDGKSLAGESYTERHVGEYSGMFLGKGFTRTVGIFVPNTYLATSRLTPLSVALGSTKNPEVITALLEAGATVDEDAMRSAPDHNDKSGREIVILLLQHAPPLVICESVHNFAFNHDKEMLDYCFASLAPATPNCLLRDNGMTPFLYAAMNNTPEMVEYLLEKGADIEKSSEQGNNPLYLALYHGHVETANLLLARGADATRNGSKGKSLLYLAVVTGEIRDEALLRRLAARISLSGEAEDQAVRAACYSGNTKVLSTLLSRGAALRQDVEYIVDENAAGQKEMVDFLSAKGVKAKPGQELPEDMS